MKIVLFGGSGMVGQGVLRECLLDEDVATVVSIVRKPTAQKHDKLQEIIHDDFLDYSTLKTEFAGADACFYCLGVSSGGMEEEEYRRLTYDLTLSAGKALSDLNRDLVFVYVSGQGTDSTEKGRVMWARVKGKTENALLRLPIKAAYMFRPGLIQPLHGIKSKTKAYRILYTLTAPILPLLKALFPNNVTTTEQVGRAMLKVTKSGYPRSILEVKDINSLSA
jgi:uncharacterized protein YbjT (DUF2867 family)